MTKPTPIFVVTELDGCPIPGGEFDDYAKACDLAEFCADRGRGSRIWVRVKDVRGRVDPNAPAAIS